MELAKRLKKRELRDETMRSMSTKLEFGTIVATFLIATPAALELEGVRLEDI